MKQFGLLFLFFLLLAPLSINAQTLSVPPSTLNQWRARGGFTRDLKVGSTGFDVYVLKQYLLAQFPTQLVSLDPTFDKNTYTLLSSYEVQQELPSTGLFAKDTRARVEDNLVDELCNTDDSIEYSDPLLKYLPLDRAIALPDGFAPSDLAIVPSSIKTNGIICLDPETLAAFTVMYNDALTDGTHLLITSGYRRPEIQNYLKVLLAGQMGSKAKEVIAEPGHSEHQLGTALDLAARSHGYISTDYSLDTTPEFRWLDQHAYQYGFVLSYPKGQELVTGYRYEPWHWRFVGVDIAAKVHETGEVPVKILRAIQ